MRPCAPLAWLALFAASCSNSGPVAPASDAAVVDSSVPGVDATPGDDGAASLSWVDLAVSGCATVPGPPDDSGDGDAGPVEFQPCTGSAPLTLRFTALTPATVDSYRWSFGDGEMSEDADPSHVYHQPGVYSVTLIVGGPSGIAEIDKPGLIEVVPGALGAACDDTPQCEAGLSCMCGDGADCTGAFTPGRCVAECSAGVPCAQGVCVDLAAGGPSDPQPWQRTLCLPTCGADGPCPAGTRCQEVLDAQGSWQSACMTPGLLGDIGDSCAGGDGQLSHSACASGLCADLGARGVCAAPCIAGNCPPSSACATFTQSGQAVCLARCPDEGACDSDPWLACEAPDDQGDFSFTVDEMPAEFGYCAPRSCADASECGSDGICIDGHCGPAS